WSRRFRRRRTPTKRAAHLRCRPRRTPAESHGASAFPLLDTHGRVLRRVVARAEPRGRQENSQHLRVTFGRPPRKAVQRRESEQRREERIEQIEHGGAHHERQKKQGPTKHPTPGRRAER